MDKCSLYINVWSEYFAANAEQIARYDPQYTLKSICGQAIHTLKQDKTDAKKYANGLRLRNFLIKYFDEKVLSYKEGIYMCRVVVNNSKKDADFIIYNHLFSKENYRFTISQLTEELQEYNLNLSKKCVQKKIEEFVRAGLIKQNFRYYTTCKG